MRAKYNSIVYNLFDSDAIWNFAGDVCEDISDDDARRAYSAIFRDMRRAGMTSREACEDIRMQALREDLALIMRDYLRRTREYADCTIVRKFHGVRFSITF